MSWMKLEVILFSQLTIFLRCRRNLPRIRGMFPAGASISLDYSPKTLARNGKF